MNRARRSKSAHRRKPTIEALRALVVLGEIESISETARKLGVTQPVVTKKLEVFKDAEACGSVLLRSSGRVTLTESAKSVLPAVQELVRRYDRIISFLRGEETAPQLIRIGAGSFAAEHYLPKVLVAMRDVIEECQIETRVCRGRDRILGTARGVFDLSIVTYDRNQVCEVLREERLDENLVTITDVGRHQMCLLASPETEAGRELQAVPATRAVPIASLQKWELVGPDRQSAIRRQLEGRFPRGRLYFVAEGGGWAAAREYARVGLGVAIVPLATVTATDRQEMVCRTLSKEFAIADFAIQRQTEANPVLQRIKNGIIEKARGLAGFLE